MFMISRKTVVFAIISIMMINICLVGVSGSDLNGYNLNEGGSIYVFDRHAIGLTTALKFKFPIYVLDTFEKDNVGATPNKWYSRNPSKANFTVIEENGNRFARVNVPQGMSTTDSASNIPIFVRKIDESALLSDDNYTVIEAKIRTSSTNFRKMFKPNYPTDPTHQYYNELWNNYYTLWFMHSSPASFATLNGSSSTGNPPLPNTPNLFSYQTNKWYSVKSVLRTADSRWDFYVYNDAGELEFERLDLSTNIWYMNNASAIENLTFFFRNAVTLSADETFDIDNVAVYNVPLFSPRAALIYTNENCFVKDTEFDIEFSIDIDENTLNSSSVKLFTQDNTELTTTGNYDYETNKYIISPSSALETGIYRLVLDDSIIKSSGDNGEFLGGETTLEFMYYATEPPIASSVYIEGEGVVAGATLRGHYTYYSGDGISEGNSDYQWLYSDIEDGTYVPIPNATDITYVVDNKYSGGYIKFSVTPKDANGISALKTAVSDYAYPPTEPVATNVSIKGEFRVGESLIGEYDYYDEYGNLEYGSVYRWLYSNAEGGVYKKIPNANQLTYILEEDYYDKLIKFEVTPYNSKGDMGKAVTSHFVCKPMPPIAKNISISGDMFADHDIEVNYEFYDINGDSEGETEFRWLISDEEYGDYTMIEGALEKTYTLTKNEVDKFIKVEVIPKSDTEPFVGDAVTSSPYPALRRPTVKNLSIVKMSDNILKGSYEYEHIHNSLKGKSIYKWFVNGTLVSTQITCNINFTGSENVVFEVTPVAMNYPYNGETVTTTQRVTVSSSTVRYGGGTGGGFGGNVAVIPLPEIPTQSIGGLPQSDTVFIDLKNHWANEQIKYITDKGIMSGTSNNNFYPELIVTRAEFIFYIIKGLDLEASAYQNVFNDVDNNDWFADALQTALNHGFISRDERFNPYNPITREEICKILVEGLGSFVSFENYVDLSVYSDSGDISPWAADYVRKATGIELMNGVSDNMFAPKQYATRAQTAVLIKRFLDIVDKGVAQ